MTLNITKTGPLDCLVGSNRSDSSKLRADDDFRLSDRTRPSILFHPSHAADSRRQVLIIHSLPRDLRWRLEKAIFFMIMKGPLYRVLLLDMDGVLAEVSKSYRASIVATCHKYGATGVDYDLIGDWKARGGCNNDWKLSLDLINEDPNGKKGLTLDEVTETFEEFYQGTNGTPGLCELETLIPTRETMEELRKLADKVAIVTGRPRSDCDKFLKLHKLDHMIDACVCMEDGPPKPDPFPVNEACRLLGIEPSESVVLVGDTPDDIRAAIAAGCKGVGVATPEGAEEQKNLGKSFDSTKLCIAMKNCGADSILSPGFAELVDKFS